MDIVVSLLRSLGVNSTIWFQLGCFFVAYLAVTELVFKPYLRAYEERQKRTVGGEETAAKTVEEIGVLQNQYESKVRALNAEIKGIYDTSRGEAQKRYDETMSAARKQADAALESTRAQITTQVEAAEHALKSEVPALGNAIASRLAGKDLSV